ncbi:MAG: hypothetical protein LBG80_04570 [Bacteroidales bacterium]|jgi:hypothetical protein|nr:hypothetical protein [Bacteroidales bacterium]
MNPDFFIWNLDLNDSLTVVLTSQVISVALIVASICFVVNIAHNYLTTGFNSLVGDGGDPFPNYSELARCLVLIFCINAYLPIASIMVGSAEMINKATSTDHFENATAFANLQEANQIVAPGEVDPRKSADEQDLTPSGREENTKVYDASSPETGLLHAIKNLVALLSPAHLAVILFHSTASFLLMIVKVIILGIAVVLVKILIIIGPLAFAFSILPCFKKQLENWFGTLMTLCMSFTTLNILDAIVDAVTGNIFGNIASMNASKTVDTAPELIAFDAIIIVVYCSVFWLTSKYVGRADAGRVLSKMVGVATTLASIMVLGGMGSAGGGSALKGAVNAGSKAIENPGSTAIED